MNPTTKLASSMAHPNPFLAAGSPFASSPFAPLAAPAEVPADAQEGSYTYGSRRAASSRSPIPSCSPRRLIHPGG